MAPSGMTTWWLPHLDSRSVADVAQDAAPTNQLKSLSIISTSGHVLGPGLGIRAAFLCAGRELLHRELPTFRARRVWPLHRQRVPPCLVPFAGECKDLDVNAPPVLKTPAVARAQVHFTGARAGAKEGGCHLGPASGPAAPRGALQL